MKKNYIHLIPATLIIMVGLSCGYERARFECGENPFIVDEIKSYNDSLSEYSTKKFNPSFIDVLGGKATFIAKSGLYQIGDTVRLTNNR